MQETLDPSKRAKAEGVKPTVSENDTDEEDEGEDLGGELSRCLSQLRKDVMEEESNECLPLKRPARKRREIGGKEMLAEETRKTGNNIEEGETRR
eukprot:4572034-Amphidinium_carterae.1